MSWKVVSVDSFNEHSNTWDHINADGPCTPLLDSRFMLPLLINFGSGNEKLAIHNGIDANNAMAVITSHKRGVWTTFQPSQAPLGAWVNHRGNNLATLANGLIKELPGIPLLLGVTQQDPALTPRPENDSHVRAIDYIRTARITVEGSFDDYWAQRGKNLRQNLKRQRNRLSKDGVKTDLDIITDTDLIHTAVAEYGRIESSGWKTKTGTAIHPDNTQGRFYTEMLQNFSHTGDCRIYRYLYNKKVAAMDLCITGGDTLIILKTTYDESYTTSSPAMLMRQEAFNRIFEQGDIKHIEFYGKVMDWHTKWTTEIRTMYHLNCYRWSMLAKIHNPS